MTYFIQTLRKFQGVLDEKRAYPNAKDGDGVVITYNFMTHIPDNPRTGLVVDPTESFRRYSAAEEKVVRQSLKAWSSVANVTFVKSDSQVADLMFGQHEMPYLVNGYAGGLTYSFDTNTMRGADVWLDTDNFIRTPYGRQTVTHEIGHSLGLTHPRVGGKFLKPGEIATTIMASDDDDGVSPYKGSPTKLGVLDTAAIQAIYGPAHRRLGDDSYQVGKTKLIWDGGGTDTMSAAKAKAKAHLDMNDGSWSWIGKKTVSILAKDQTWLGNFTQIEKAVGSKHADLILGNGLDNMILGGKGDDTISGGGGADTFIGGPGRDRFVFKSYADFGTLDHHDQILDLAPEDRIDLRALHATFLGAGQDDALLHAATVGQFYFNTLTQELRFDANGDGVADAVLGGKLAALTAGSLLL